jgi:hypothetical protein
MDVDEKPLIDVELEIDPIAPVVDTDTEIKLGTSTFEDGTIVYYDGNFGVDTLIYIDETMETAILDGEYMLDGETLVIVEGKITEIIVAEEEVVEVVEPIEELIEEVIEEEVIVDEVIEDELDYKVLYEEALEVIADLENKLLGLENQEKQFKSEIQKLSAEPAVESLSSKPVEIVEKTLLEKRLENLDTLRKYKK